MPVLAAHRFGLAVGLAQVEGAQDRGPLLPDPRFISTAAAERPPCLLSHVLGPALCKVDIKGLVQGHTASTEQI